MVRHLYLFVMILLTALVPVRADQPLTIFAAASLREAVEEIGVAFEAETGVSVVFSFAGTGALARQIEAGAPADVFLSADEAWMAYVRDAGAVEAGTIRDFASNALVLIGPEADAPFNPSQDSFPERLGGHRLAMADPGTVPAGRYGKAALEALGVWPSVSGALAPMENVRIALTAVSRGDTPLGLVYRTDALIEPKVKVVYEFSRGSHPRIRYLAALTGERDHAAATAFLAFLSTSQAKEILRSFGFVADNEERAGDVGPRTEPAD